MKKKRSDKTILTCRFILGVLLILSVGYALFANYLNYKENSRLKAEYEEENCRKGNLSIVAEKLLNCMDNSYSDKEYIYDGYADKKVSNSQNGWYSYEIGYKKEEMVCSSVSGITKIKDFENSENSMGSYYDTDEDVFFSESVVYPTNQIVYRTPSSIYIDENSIMVADYEWSLSRYGEESLEADRYQISDNLRRQFLALFEKLRLLEEKYNENIVITMWYAAEEFEGVPLYRNEILTAIILIGVLSVFLVATANEKYTYRGRHNKKIIYIPGEICIAGIILSVIAAIILLFVIVNMQNYYVYDIRSLQIGLAAAFGVLYFTSSHIVMQIKSKSVKENLYIEKHKSKRTGRLLNVAKKILKKINVNFLAALVLVYLAYLSYETVFSIGYITEYAIIETIGILATGLIVIYVAFKQKRTDKSVKQVYERIEQLYEGDYEPKELTEESIDKDMLNKINEISVGVEEAVTKRVSSEKMKVELITNVSHDLKTPLTSIISYVDLLKDEEMSDAGRAYVKILEEKSASLKEIVSDVFEMAKAASGEQKVMEKLDGPMLVRQVLADMDDVIKYSGKQLKANIVPDTYYVMGDGKRLYRVIQNIIDNAVKYSLEGSRIYVDTHISGNEFQIKVKNVSAYEMDFTEDEITERFTRGDKSRTTEGNGLGLAIAKSFTEGSEGKFEINIDGDIFCVNIFLKSYKQERDI